MEYYIRVQSGTYTRTYIYTFDKSTLRYLLLNRRGHYAHYLDIFAKDLECNKVNELCKQNKWEF